MAKQKDMQRRIITAKVSDLKENPDNPRTITGDALEKLKASIREFPAMLQLRPIVVDADMVVLGGNMRLRACKELGITEVPIIAADTLTEKEKERFIIADNVSFGEWDYDTLANDWDVDELEAWGVEEKKATAKQQKGRYSIVSNYHIFKVAIGKDDIGRLMDKLEYVMLENGFETHADALLHIVDKHKR